MTRENVVAYLPWLLSAITIWMTVLAGNKHPSAWLNRLRAQSLEVEFDINSVSTLKNGNKNRVPNHASSEIIGMPTIGIPS